jgi:hypothetical protein
MKKILAALIANESSRNTMKQLIHEVVAVRWDEVIRSRRRETKTRQSVDKTSKRKV